MTIVISCFSWVPPFAQGHVRDLRPRWALVEAGLDYGRFGVADIVMATVPRGLQDEPVLARFRSVAAYLERCLAREGFRTALAAQLATFAQNEPA